MNDLHESDHVYLKESARYIVEMMAREIVGECDNSGVDFIDRALKFGKASWVYCLTSGDAKISVRIDISKSEIEV